MVNYAERLWSLRESYFELCTHYPLLGVIIMAVLLTTAAYILANNLVQFVRALRTWMQSTRGKVAFGIGFCVVLSLSTAAVMSINAALAPIPIFKDVQTFLMGEYVFLKWSYGDVNANEPALYEVESAADSHFSIVEKEGLAEGLDKPIARPINATRFWRVRAVELTGSDRPLSRWSRPIAVEQYESAVKRIAATKVFSVFFSNSVDQGIFKFRSDNERKANGFDYKLAEVLAEKLPDKLHIDGPLTLKPMYVPWKEWELLKSPAKGRADMIISTISALPEREKEHDVKFSAPYHQTTQSLIYRCGEADQPIRVRLAGKRVGVQQETTSEALLTALKSEMAERAPVIQTFPQARGIVDALLKPTPTIDYGLTDTPFAIGAHLKYRLNGASRLAYKELTPADFPPSIPHAQRIENYAVAVRQSEVELLAAINGIIADMRVSGELANLLDQAKREYALTVGGPVECPAVAVSR